MLWRGQSGMGKATCNRKKLLAWLFRRVLSPFPCGRLRLQDCAPGTYETCTTDLRLCTEIRKIDACPFLIDKFCKETIKRSGNSWKKSGKRMRSRPACYSPGRLHSGGLSEQGVIYSDGALKVCSPQQWAGSASPASHCLQLKQRSVKETV